jgi:hypothetical protein
MLMELFLGQKILSLKYPGAAHDEMSNFRFLQDFCDRLNAAECQLLESKPDLFPWKSKTRRGSSLLRWNMLAFCFGLRLYRG